MALRIAVGSSNKKEIRNAVQEALFSCRKKFPVQEANLVIVFSTPNFANTNLLTNIKQNLRPETPLVGCSSLAVITSEDILYEGLVIIAISCPEVKFSCGSIDQIKQKGAYLSGQELSSYILSTVRSYRRELCLIFSDGLLDDTSAFLKGMQNILGYSFPFIGGGASGNPGFKQTSQYYNETVMVNGAVATLFTGKINYSLSIMHGWKPLGKIRTITESQTNIIKSIDGKKAIHLYEDYFAKTLTQLKKEIAHINILYPIGIYLPGENEYLLRNVLALNDDGSIISQGDIPQESQIRLMIGTKDSCLRAARQAAMQVRKQMQSKKIDLCIVISSTSRANFLGRKIKEEIRAIRENIGENVPLAGFYSYGEQAPLKWFPHYYGQSYHHNQTITILGIGPQNAKEDI